MTQSYNWMLGKKGKKKDKGSSLKSDMEETPRDTI